MKNFDIKFYSEWGQLFRKYNWYNMTLINIELENDNFMGDIFFEITLLGLTVRFVYHTPKFYEMVESFKKDIEKLKKRKKK